MTLNQEQRKQLIKAFRAYHKWCAELNSLSKLTGLNLKPRDFEKVFTDMVAESKPNNIVWASRSMFERNLI